MCNMCGRCCRMIHFNDDIHYKIQSKSTYSNIGGIEFIRKNMEYIGPSYKIPGAFKRRNGDSWHVYKCKLVTEDNKCSVHENKPQLCSGYPYYEGGKGHGSLPWPYKDCAYTRDRLELDLLRILRLHLRNMEDKIDNKRKITDSSQKGISGKRLRESIPA